LPKDVRLPTSPSPIALWPAINREDDLLCKAIRQDFPLEEIDGSPKRKNCGVFFEWTVVQTQLFKVQSGTFTTHGFLVSLLPQTVVSSENAE